MDSIEHLDFEPGEEDEPLGDDADGAPKQDPSKNTPSGQNSVVPLGWKPTPNAPLPVVRCIQIKKDGIRCGRWSLRGGTKCYKHGGNGGKLKNVEEHRKAMIEAARLRILDDTDMAIDTLEFLMSNPGTAEAIKLKSATEVLDRAGVRGGFEVDIAGDITVSPVDEIRKRLTELRKGSEELARMQGEIVEGEIIEDDGQEALFELDTDEDES